eukprot:6106422-Pyramimonas_sp.AAC.1
MQARGGPPTRWTASCQSQFQVAPHSLKPPIGLGFRTIHLSANGPRVQEGIFTCARMGLASVEAR